jgi:hypothetical protein
VPDAEVEVVLYRRSAQRLFGQFIPAGALAQRLASIDPRRLQPGNGSHLELGAAEAARALGQATGPGRVVLSTDDLLSDGFSLEAAIAALASAPPGTVTHVVVRRAGSGGLSESRDDSSDLAPLAAAGSGVVLDVRGSAAADPATARATLEGLVRPVRIDGLAVEAVGLTSDTVEVPDVLREGQALRQTAFAPKAPPRITVRGKLWARAIEAQLEIDPVLSHQLPGLALGDEGVEPQLDDAERLQAARAAHAVSSLTSFLAAPVGAAPSTAGAAEFRLSCTTCSACGGMGFSRGMRGHTTMSSDAPLRPALVELVRPIVERCGAPEGAALGVETTHDEIVDVQVTGVADPACLTEGLWGLRLPERFRGHLHFAL